jgi:hypothetical protein
MSHDYFRAYREGHEYNGYVADYLRSKGIDCEVPDLEIEEDPTRWSKFTQNEKDIILANGDVIEVKSINQNFTDDPSSWPLERAIVDTYSGFNGKSKRPIAYVFVSQKTKKMLAMSAEKPSAWSVERKFDKYRQKEDDFYFAPKSMLRPMDKLVEYLRGRQ